MANDQAATIREAVAIFHDADSLQQAIDDLLSAGSDRAELSLLAGADAVAAKLGHRYEKVSELEDDASVPRTVYVSTEAMGDAEGALFGGLVYVGAVAAAGIVVATGGALASIIAAASLAGGTGGLIGAGLARLMADHHAHYLQEQIDRGGLLLWVHVRSPEHEQRVTAILRKHSGEDVHVHELPAP